MQRPGSSFRTYSVLPRLLRIRQPRRARSQKNSTQPANTASEAGSRDRIDPPIASRPFTRRLRSPKAREQTP